MNQSHSYHRVLANQQLISEQLTKPGLTVVLRELETAIQRNISGDIVEFGCYIGTASLFIRRLLDQLDPMPERKLYAYDSFEGLPLKTPADASGAGEQFQVGELRVSKKQFLQEFQKAHLEPPITHKAWFKDLRPEQLPDTIAFAFLDGDFYESILQSLHLVWPRLSPGGTITIDDYQRTALPGVERAVRDFFHSKPVTIRQEHQIAIIKVR